MTWYIAQFTLGSAMFACRQIYIYLQRAPFLIQTALFTMQMTTSYYTDSSMFAYRQLCAYIQTDLCLYKNSSTFTLNHKLQPEKLLKYMQMLFKLDKMFCVILEN